MQPHYKTTSMCVVILLCFCFIHYILIAYLSPPTQYYSKRTGISSFCSCVCVCMCSNVRMYLPQTPPTDVVCFRLSRVVFLQRGDLQVFDPHTESRLVCLLAVLNVPIAKRRHPCSIVHGPAWPGSGSLCTLGSCGWL